MTDFMISDNTSLMHQMIRTGNLAGVKECLNRGVDFRQRCITRDFAGYLPLHLAARMEASTTMQPIIDALLKAGAGIDDKGCEDGKTAVMTAAQFEKWRSFERLLNAGANPYEQNKAGLDLLHVLVYGHQNYKTAAATAYFNYANNLKKAVHQKHFEPAELRRTLIGDDGAATGMAKAYTYAHALPEIFALHHWKGKEAQATELFANLIAAMPASVKKIALADVDMSVLHSAAVAGDTNEKSAVERYNRNKDSKGNLR